MLFFLSIKFMIFVEFIKVSCAMLRNDLGLIKFYWQIKFYSGRKKNNILKIFWKPFSFQQHFSTFINFIKLDLKSPPSADILNY